MSRFPSQPNRVLFGVFIALLVGTVVATLSAQAVDLMGGREGAGYQLQLPGSGGVPPYRWEVVKGDLPPGLGLNQNTGALSGRLTKAGEYEFTLRLTDARGQRVDDVLKLRVGPAQTRLMPLEVLTTNLPQGVKGQLYNVKIATRGGVAPVSCQLRGNLPKGLRFDSQTCGIEGTPEEAVAGKLTIVARDAQESPIDVATMLELSVVSPGSSLLWTILPTVLATLGSVAIWRIIKARKQHLTCPVCSYRPIEWRDGLTFYCPKEQKTRTWGLGDAA